MSGFAHTPGPWRSFNGAIFTGKPACCNIASGVRDDDADRAASAVNEVDRAGLTNEALDAGVISALVEALEDISSGLTYVLQRHGELPGVGFDRALNAARAALALARGEQGAWATYGETIHEWEPTFTLERQIAQARRDIPASRRAELEAEWTIGEHEAEQRHLARWNALLSNTRAKAADARRNGRGLWR
jgi:hypothetical protein